MNLKEAYTYSNCLDTLLSAAYTYLRSTGFVTTKTEAHLRSKANPDAQDETIEVQKPFDVDFTPNDVIDFTVKVLDEKESLVNAIAEAKVTTEIDIDNAIHMNKKRQEFVYVLNTLASIKASETQSKAKDYKFDVNGEQKPYFYDVTTVTSIDFDRNDVKALSKKLASECDQVSAKLDAIEINTVVDFTPKFDVHETFEDLIVAS
jgi:translation initiation factor 1 (eIF-1/SUI1)